MDLLTCPIVPGTESTIEIASENIGLGLFFVGGKDTVIPVSSKSPKFIVRFKNIIKINIVLQGFIYGRSK